MPKTQGSLLLVKRLISDIPNPSPETACSNDSDSEISDDDNKRDNHSSNNSNRGQITGEQEQELQQQYRHATTQHTKNKSSCDSYSAY